MLVLIPPQPSFTTVAEREVWEALKATLAAEDVLAANLRISDEFGDHEADLVVVKASPDSLSSRANRRSNGCGTASHWKR